MNKLKKKYGSCFETIVDALAPSKRNEYSNIFVQVQHGMKRVVLRCHLVIDLNQSPSDIIIVSSPSDVIALRSQL